jgi:hypothetical protein
MATKKISKTYEGKSTKLGGGGQFAKLTDEIQETGKSKQSAEAIAASIGRKKLGNARFNQLAAAGRKRANKK